MNLYEQLRAIEAQFRRRCFTSRETGEMMRLCIYSCVAQFPGRATQLPFRDHVLASPRSTHCVGTARWLPTVRAVPQPLSIKVKTPSQSDAGGVAM